MNNFFGPGSPYLSHPLLTDERTMLEVDRILDYRLAHAGDAPTVDVLDIGCGFGRHAVELSRRGKRVVGVDPSIAMLNAAQQKAATAGLEIEFVRSTAEDFQRPAAFDLVVSLFTSFGQVTSSAIDDGGAACAQGLARALRSRATLVIEIPERGKALAGLIPEEVFGATTVTRHFDEETAQIRETFLTPSKTFDLAYRLYEREELCALLEGFDLAIVDVVDEALVTPPSTFMTIVAERTR